jgi:hypothetical protein
VLGDLSRNRLDIGDHDDAETDDGFSLGRVAARPVATLELDTGYFSFFFDTSAGSFPRTQAVMKPARSPAEWSTSAIINPALLPPSSTVVPQFGNP